MALEKLDGISSAYINDGIILHLDREDGYDQKVVEGVLKSFQIKITSAKAGEGSPFTPSPVKG